MLEEAEDESVVLFEVNYFTRSIVACVSGVTRRPQDYSFRASILWRFYQAVFDRMYGIIISRPSIKSDIISQFCWAEVNSTRSARMFARWIRRRKLLCEPEAI